MYGAPWRTSRTAQQQTPRVTVKIADVAHLIQSCAKDGKLEKFDAIVLDLYTGPYSGTNERDDPLYGSIAIDTTRAAIKPGGVFAVWGEDYDAYCVRVGYSFPM